MAGDETHKERIDRELIELLNELRVALPGVEVLFAFLLTLPFSQRFGQLTPLQRNTYYATFLCTAVASIFLIAPTAYHRIRWRRYDKERMLFTANRQAITGVAFLALAVGGAVFLISDMLFGVPAAAVAGGTAALLVAWLWFGLPLVRGRDAPADTEPR
jgi:predicted neutral ceramidase superfamily lipid hydrolase